ncbi:MAG: hypothetical protein PHY16_05845 [Methylobacter sp.]|nr:hypothetical protein [Methylobacter sp.]
MGKPKACPRVLKRAFYTTLKNNIKVSLSKEAGYGHLDALEWTSERLPIRHHRQTEKSTVQG